MIPLMLNPFFCSYFNEVRFGFSPNSKKPKSPSLSF
jgi:hypothetical protein